MTDFTELDDEQLVSRIVEDSSAYSILYNRYFLAIYRYIFHRVGNTMDAEDLTSRVFMNALDGLANNQYAHKGKFSAWLFTIARHRVIDFYRTNKDNAPAELPEFIPDALHSMEQTEDLKHLAKLVAQMKEETQELLQLRFAAGLDFGTIARIVGRTEPGVKIKIHRAIKRLQDQWEEKND